MALTDDQQRRLLRALVRELEAAGPVTLTKPQIIAAATAVDDWLTSIAAALNSAIPAAARSALTTPQKAALLSFVAEARFGGGQ